MGRAWPLLILALLAASTVTAAQAEVVDLSRVQTEYDAYFRKYTKRYFGPHFDWRWFKAQAIAESRLDPAVKSPVGAVGIMQIMPATFAEIKKLNPHFERLEDPRWNIAAGIFYDRQLYRKWRRPLPGLERLFLTFASYNAGYGGVLKAVKRTGKQAPTWPEVEPHLPGQTRSYVSQIHRLVKRGRRLRGAQKFLRRS